MSFAAARESKLTHKICECCHARKARFQYRGIVRADRHHTLCFECYRSEHDRRRARLLAGVRFHAPLRSVFLQTSKGQGALSHRMELLRPR